MPDITIDTLSIEIDKKGQPSSDALKNLKDRLVVLKDLSDSVAKLGGQGVQGLDAFAKAIGNIQSAIDKLDSSKLQNLKITAQQKKSSSGKGKSKPKGVTFSGIEKSAEEDIPTATTSQVSRESKTVTNSTHPTEVATEKAFDGASKVDSVIANVQKKTEMLSSDLNARLARMVDEADKSFLHLGEVYGNKPFMGEAIEQSKSQIQELVDDYKNKIAELKDVAPFASAIADNMSAKDSVENFNRFRDAIDVAYNDLKNLTSTDVSGMSVQFKQIVKDVKDLADELAKANGEKRSFETSTNDSSTNDFLDRAQAFCDKIEQLIQRMKDGDQSLRGDPYKWIGKAFDPSKIVIPKENPYEWIGKAFDPSDIKVKNPDKWISKAFNKKKEIKIPVIPEIVKGAIDKIKHKPIKVNAKIEPELTWDKVLKRIKSTAKGLGSLLGKVWKQATSGVRDFASKLDRVRKRFGQLVLTRALRKIITEFGKAVKEGVDNLYQWSKALNGEFARSMDQASASTLYLKNSFGAMVAPIVNALVPALDAIINSIVGVMNAFNQLFALLGGQTYWTKAIKQQKDYAKATGGSTKANKDYLLSIDELNVLNDDKGGGGGGSAMDYSNMFEDVTVFDDWAKKIQEAIDEGDWYGVGEIIGKKLNEVILDLDTAQWGSNLAVKINHALDASLGLLETINTKLWGGKVSAFFNKIFEEVNFDTAGEVLATKTNKLWEFFLGIVQTFKWDVAGKAFQDGINGWIGKIDPSTITSTFNTLWQGVMKVITDVATADWGTLGTKVGEAINNFDWKGNIGSLTKAVQSIGEGLFELIGSAIKTIDWETLGREITEGLFGSLNFENLDVKLSKAVLELVRGIGQLVIGILEALFPKWSGKLQEFSDRFDTGIDNAKASIDEAVALSKARAETALDTVGTHVETTVTTMDGEFAKIASMNYVDQWETTDVEPSLATAEETANTTVDNIVTKTATIGGMTYFGDFYKTDALPNLETIAEKSDATRQQIEDNFAPVGRMSVFEQYWGKDAKPWMDEVSEHSGVVEAEIENAFGGIKVMNPFATWKKDDVDPVFGGLSYDNMKAKGADIASGISAGLKSIPLPTLDVTTATRGVMVGVKEQLMSIPSFTWRAGGGFPDQGEMFIARENGAEMVGRIGNKTAVANNDQIVDAIAYGVYQAVTEAGGMGGGAQTINVVAELDGQKMYESNKTVGRDRGYDLGMGAFGYVNNI